MFYNKNMSICTKCKKPEESYYHKQACPLLGTPAPDDSKARKFKTIEQVREWLSHPSNHVVTELYVVKYNGHIPKVSVHHFEDVFKDTAIAESVIYQQTLVRQKGRKNDNRVSTEDDY
jgi:hypothetical protein